MPERKTIVMNTGPAIALVAAMGSLDWLKDFYEQVLLPLEVCQEVLVGGADNFAVDEILRTDALTRLNEPITISPFLLNSLDRGEAAVIQQALDRAIGTVCIDEAAGRRIERLNGLSLTGSLGILLRAKGAGMDFKMSDAVERMRRHGVWLSERLTQQVIALAGEP